MSFRWPVRVYIEDTDMGGVVFYANYLRYLERARTELLRSLGYEQHRLQAEGLVFVVRRLTADYRAPARLDDQLEVTVQVEKLAGARLDFAQRIERNGELLVAAEVQVAAVDARTLRPCRVPAEMAEGLKTYLVQQSCQEYRSHP